jgi:tight adherence protein B
MTAWLPVALAAAAAVFAVPGGDGTWRLGVVAPARRLDRSPLLAGAALLAAAAFVLAGAVAAVLALIGAGVVQRSRVRRRQAALARQERAGALDALALLAADLRAGRTPADALAAAAEIACGDSAAALAAAAGAVRLGGDVGSALDAERSAVAPTLRALAACWQVCSDAGSGLAAAVERLEEAMRAAEAQRRSIAAELAGPRATAQLLAALPLVGIGLAAALGARPLEVLLGTPVGLTCLAVGLALDALGVVWTRRLAERAMP